MSEANRAKAIAKYGQVLQSKKNLWTTVSDATIKSGAPIGGVLLGGPFAHIQDIGVLCDPLFNNNG